MSYISVLYYLVTLISSYKAELANMYLYYL